MHYEQFGTPGTDSFQYDNIREIKIGMSPLQKQIHKNRGHSFTYKLMKQKKII